VDRNDFANFDYVAADRMIIEGRAAFSASSLVLVPWSQSIGGPIADAAATLQAVYRVCHTSGEWIEIAVDVPVVTKKGTPSDKAAFGSRTEGLGYIYRELLSIGRLDAREVSGRDDTDYEPPPPQVAAQGAAAVAQAAQQQPTAQSDTGAVQLAGEYIAQVKAIESAAAVDGADLADLLRALEAIPAAAAGANLGEALQGVACAYNPVVTALRARIAEAAA